MNWAIVIPVGIGIAVLLSIALVAIDVSGQISRKEEADEVEFLLRSLRRQRRLLIFHRIRMFPGCSTTGSHSALAAPNMVAAFRHECGTFMASSIASIRGSA